MKLIHLSDLHLGKRLHQFSLLEDQRHILGEILRVLDDERPDAVVIAGDVYDKPVPPAEAVELLDGFLVELARRYIVKIKGKETCLYETGGRWFVEMKA